MFLPLVSACTTVDINRTTPSAWYYERYNPAKDRIVDLDDIKARVLVYRNVHFSKSILDKEGNATGSHYDGWRSETEVFFAPDNLPVNALDAAVVAIEAVCDGYIVGDVLEEHPHYVRLAGGC